MIQVKNRQITPPESLAEQRDYDGEDVKIALSNLSTGCKCVYCERILPKLEELNTNSIRAIEHFYPKTIYHKQKFEWKNLFWVCKNCNSTKRHFDTLNEPFVHPENDNPENYFEYSVSHRIKIATDSPNQIKSENTIARTMEKRSLEISWGSKILLDFQKFEIDLESSFKKYQQISQNIAKIRHLEKIIDVFAAIKGFANDDEEYAGRRRWLIRNSEIIQVITQEINNNKEILGLTEDFEWKW